MDRIDLNLARPRWPAMLILAVASLGDAILRSARLYLTEQALCREFFQIEDPALIRPDGSVEEFRCKSNSIQASVSLVYGLFDVVTLLCGLVATPVYTRLVHAIGRRNILLINIGSMAVGAFYSTAVYITQVFFHGLFDYRMVWLTGVFDLIGGGMPVRNTLVYTYIAEVVRANALSETLYQLSTLNLVMSFLGTALGAMLLNVDVWLLSLFGVGVCALALPLVFLLRPTYRAEAGTRETLCVSPQPLYGILPQGEEEDARDIPLADVPDDPSTQKGSLSQTLSAIVTEASLSLGLLADLLRDSLTGVTMLIYLCDETAIYVRLAFPQYASKRFDWSLAGANAITSFQIVVNGAVLLLLPLVSRRLLRPILGSQNLVDFWVIKTSLIFNIVGIFCAGVAPVRALYIMSLGVYNLGAALTDSLRSFVTGTMRDEEEVQRLYMGISMVETIAGLLGTTLWSSAFSAGMRYGGTALGRVPFIAAAGLFGVSLWLTSVLRKLSAKRQFETADRDEE